MGRFFGRLSGALSRFLYGRNGTDQLGTAVLVVYLALMKIGRASWRERVLSHV